MTRKPNAKHTQKTHDKCRNERSKFINKHWKHTNTIHKPYTKHTHKSHTRNAETLTTGSQKSNENTPKKVHRHTASS